MNSSEAEGDAAFCRKCTPFSRRRNKWNSSYQPEENNNPGLDLSSPVNDRGNYAHIVKQANRITVRFSLWLGCHPPIIVVPPDWSSPSRPQSLSSPFHCLSCFIFSFVSSCSHSLPPSLFFFFFSPLRIVLQANESKAGGNSLARWDLQPVRALFSAPQCLHTPGQPGKYSCPSLFPRSLLTLLLPLN